MINETPVYTLGSWVGNQTDAFGVDWVVTGEDGWSSSPPVRPTQEDKQGGDGAWSGPGLWSARVVTLSGTAIAADRASMLAAKRRLKSAVGPRVLTPLQVDEADLSLTSLVRLSDQIQITDKGSVGFTWSLIVVAPDPRRYATSSTTQSTGLPSSATSGRTYPRTYPYTYGGGTGGQTGSVYFTQDGDFDETPAVITVYGPVINPTVSHVQTNRTLTFTITLADGEYLVIDLLARTALQNGMSARGSAVTPGSAWFMAVPGLNEFQFRGQAGTSLTDPPTTPSMTVTAASAWT